MRVAGLILGVFGFAGCATGARIEGGGDGVDSGTATSLVIDSAESCDEVTTQLLVNGNFDATPLASGWIETRIADEFSLITADAVADTAPNLAWLGGLAQANANDQLVQDVAIPARTSALALTGLLDVRTNETGAVVRDTATVALTRLDNTPIETALSTDNTRATTDWTPLTYAFSVADLSGQTFRFKIASSNNATANSSTSFFFDNLSLVATHCR